MDKFTTALAIKNQRAKTSFAVINIYFQFRGSDNQPMVVMINVTIIEIVTPIL